MLGIGSKRGTYINVRGMFGFTCNVWNVPECVLHDKLLPVSSMKYSVKICVLKQSQLKATPACDLHMILILHLCQNEKQLFS